MSENESKTEPRHGGRRPGAGRTNEGKKTYSVTLVASDVEKAKQTEKNLSRLLSRLLSEFLKK